MSTPSEGFDHLRHIAEESAMSAGSDLLARMTLEMENEHVSARTLLVYLAAQWLAGCEWAVRYAQRRPIEPLVAFLDAIATEAGESTERRQSVVIEDIGYIEGTNHHGGKS